jgi:hypothetical protein
MSRRNPFFHAGVKPVADFLVIYGTKTVNSPSLRRRLFFASLTISSIALNMMVDDEAD